MKVTRHVSIVATRSTSSSSRSPAQGDAFAAVGSPYAAYRRASRHRDELDALQFRAKLFEVAPSELIIAGLSRKRTHKKIWE
jgi:hypothetical protein